MRMKFMTNELYMKYKKDILSTYQLLLLKMNYVRGKYIDIIVVTAM